MQSRSVVKYTFNFYCLSSVGSHDNKTRIRCLMVPITQPAACACMKGVQVNICFVCYKPRAVTLALCSFRILTSPYPRPGITLEVAYEHRW